MIKRAKDLIPGGKADNRPDSDFDAEQIEAGTKVESEHVGDDEVKAKEISKDHLAEIPDYYTRLKKMEDAATKKGNMMVKAKKKNPGMKAKILLKTNKPNKVFISPVKMSSLRRAEILSVITHSFFGFKKEGKLMSFNKQALPKSLEQGFRALGRTAMPSAKGLKVLGGKKTLKSFGKLVGSKNKPGLLSDRELKLLNRLKMVDLHPDSRVFNRTAKKLDKTLSSEAIRHLKRLKNSGMMGGYTALIPASRDLVGVVPKGMSKGLKSYDKLVGSKNEAGLLRSKDVRQLSKMRDASSIDKALKLKKELMERLSDKTNKHLGRMGDAGLLSSRSMGPFKWSAARLLDNFLMKAMTKRGSMEIIKNASDHGRAVRVINAVHNASHRLRG